MSRIIAPTAYGFVFQLVDLEIYDKETDIIQENHQNMVKDLINSGLAYTAAMAIGVGVGAGTTYFDGTPVTHIFLAVYTSVGFCAFLLAKILREYMAGLLFGILGVWMAAALTPTVGMHRTVGVNGLIVIACGTGALVIITSVCVELAHAAKMLARRSNRPVIGVMPKQATL